MIKSFVDTYLDYNVHVIPCRTDNYTFVVEKNGEGVLIDSSLYEPVAAYLAENQIKLKGILITHHHYDHVDGIKQLALDHNCEIYCSKIDFERNAIPEAHKKLSENDKPVFIGLEFKTLETPGHTAGHISFYIKSLNLLFCADTLFSIGCGRVFSDGSFESLYKSLNKLTKLPDETIIYCAHEYTLDNVEFSIFNELNQPQLKTELEDILLKKERTVPTTLLYEKLFNPFIKQQNQQDFTALRALKDTQNHKEKS